MRDYVIFADSACDIPPALLQEWGVRCESLSFRFHGEDREWANGEMAPAEFYARMRAGQVATTSAVNIDTFKRAFEEELAAGRDVLYLGFSSGLSATCQSGIMAGRELEEEHPGSRVVAVDTLCASAGFGMLVYLAVQRKKAGATLDEAAQFARDTIPHLCHWFTVDDLKYLKRGGRVSATAALLGGMLGIKPVLHTDDSGHLTPVSKVRGRKASLEALADRYLALAQNPGEGPVFISHGDCLKDVETLKGMLWTKCGAKVDLVCDVGPVIGAHSGPGTVALFFLGRER